MSSLRFDIHKSLPTAVLKSFGPKKSWHHLRWLLLWPWTNQANCQWTSVKTPWWSDLTFSSWWLCRGTRPDDQEWGNRCAGDWKSSESPERISALKMTLLRQWGRLHMRQWGWHDLNHRVLHSQPDETELCFDEVHQDQWLDSRHHLQWGMRCSWQICERRMWPSSDPWSWCLHHSRSLDDLCDEWLVHEVQSMKVLLTWPLLYLYSEDHEEDWDLWRKEMKHKSLWPLSLSLWVEWSHSCWVYDHWVRVRQNRGHWPIVSGCLTLTSLLKLLSCRS